MQDFILDLFIVTLCIKMPVNRNKKEYIIFLISQCIIICKASITSIPTNQLQAFFNWWKTTPGLNLYKPYYFSLVMTANLDISVSLSGEMDYSC